MEHDTKRARGQWRGCYAFTDIICDGDGANSSKRTGGLKMGATYYYYYELDNGTEVHDPSVPFTTSCPYLPGQPVNLLQVPVEIQPIRLRSASVSSMTIGDIMTMNPADKFVAPRPPPPTPMATRRSNTSPNSHSPTVPSPKRPARSVSPKSDKSLWSPRSFFGLRSPHESDCRGRSASLSRVAIESPRVYSPRQVTSVPHTRTTSPQSLAARRRSNSQEKKAAIGHPSLPREASHLSVAALIPDEIVEEGEDDDNFASQVNFSNLYDRGIFTQLSPPPTGLRSPPSRRAVTSTSKPLPELPESNLVPQPLRLRAFASAAELPKSHFSISTVSTSDMPRSHFSTSTVSTCILEARSHFSTSTISTLLDSPTDSTFAYNGSDDEEDLVVDEEDSDEFTCSPVSDTVEGRGFTGYSLPEDEYSSQHTLRKDVCSPNSRMTFGGAVAAGETDLTKMTALEELMSEVGYLGGSIIGGAK